MTINDDYSCFIVESHVTAVPYLNSLNGPYSPANLVTLAPLRYARERPPNDRGGGWDGGTAPYIWSTRHLVIFICIICA